MANMTFELDIKSDENGELLIILPHPLLQSLKWFEGDIIRLDSNDNEIRAYKANNSSPSSNNEVKN